MSRKRKKKKLTAGSAEAGWTTTDLDRVDEGKGNLRSQIITRRLMLDEPDAPQPMAGTPRMNSTPADEWGGDASKPPQPPKGLFGRMKRWFGGSDPAPAEQAPQEFPSGKAAISGQDKQAASSTGAPTTKWWRPASSSTGRGGPGVDHVHAVIMLERVLPELEGLRRQLAEEREAAKVKFSHLEAERDQARAAAEKARVERNEIEVHTNVLRKSVTALERQLQEERGAAAKQAQELEAERNRARSEGGVLEGRVRPVEGGSEAGGALEAELRAQIAQERAEREKLESLLQSARADLEEARQHTQQDQGSAKEQIRRLEEELERRMEAGEQARLERGRIEERAGTVQRTVESLEQQLREEREGASSRIRELEADRDKHRAMCAELEEQARTLKEEKEAAQRRSRNETNGSDAGAGSEAELEEAHAVAARFETRIKSLEEELDAALQEKQAAASRLQSLEDRAEELRSQILPKDEEIQELREQADGLGAELERLKAMLTEVRDQQRAAASEAAGGAVADGGSGTGGLSSEAVEALYHQSMARLTVLLACADIVLMNPKLESSVRQTSQEIKTQGQALLDVIKSFTVPSESQQNH